MWCKAKFLEQHEEETVVPPVVPPSVPWWSDGGYTMEYFYVLPQLDISPAKSKLMAIISSSIEDNGSMTWVVTYKPAAKNEPGVPWEHLPRRGPLIFPSHHEVFKRV